MLVGRLVTLLNSWLENATVSIWVAFQELLVLKPRHEGWCMNGSPR